MTLVPELQIGLWNAWILMLYYPLQPLTLFLADRFVSKADLYHKLQMSSYRQSKKTLFIEKSVIIILVIYSLFLPIKVDTIWFFIGLPIYLLGLAIFMIAMVVSFETLFVPYPRDNFGIYLRLQYFSQPLMLVCFVTFLGVSLMTSSWFFFILSFIFGGLVSKVIGDDRLFP